MPEQSIYLRDLGRVEDGADVATGFALVNGRRADLHAHRQDGRRFDACRWSTSSRRTWTACARYCLEDVKLTLEFDQSPYVTGAIDGVVEESASERS